MQISGKAPDSNHVFVNFYASRVFSLMPRFKSINFYENKAKIKLFLQINKIFQMLGLRPQSPNGLLQSFRIPKTAPPFHCRFLVTRLILNVCCAMLLLFFLLRIFILLSPDSVRRYKYMTIRTLFIAITTRGWRNPYRLKSF